MGQSPKIVGRQSCLAVCVAAALLASCSSGGGVDRSQGPTLVRPTAPPPPPPAPPARSTVPPPAPPLEAAPAPPAINAPSDNLVRQVATSESIVRLSTTGSLTKQGVGALWLEGTNRFDGGLQIQQGSVFTYFGDLFADVDIAHGTSLELMGDVIGDVVNDGTFDPMGSYYEHFSDADIFGNYSQSPEATLAVLLGAQSSAPATPLLTVSGTATLAGTLQIAPLFATTLGYFEWILHAHGGITGQFDRWTTAQGSLFITGEMQQTPSDVYFMATRVATQAVMASAGADAMTLSGAARVDRAFADADAFAGLPAAALSDAQRRFLASGIAIQAIGDVAQATATFDSLSGQGLVSAHSMLLDQARPSTQLLSRLDRLQPGNAGAWTQRLHAGAGAGADSYSGTGVVSGFDQWFGERLLFGSTLSRGELRAEFGREAGQARSPAQIANAYLHYRGDNALYATGLIGAGQTRLVMDRTLDLAAAGRHNAHSERDVDMALLHAEAGRHFDAAGGRLTPFVALDHASLHSDGFTEAGGTGFELAAQPTRMQRTSADIGARYARRWRFGDDAWVRMDLGGSYQHVLAQHGEALHAAFVGAPLAQFDIAPSVADALDGHGRIVFDLAGGWNQRWSWSFNYTQGLLGAERGAAWWLGLRWDL